MKIGLFFGSFNPIHIGHLIIADTVAQQTPFSQVWFVVSPQNPFKKNSSLLHEFDRIDMVRAAIADNPHFNVSDIELHMPRPSYTIDTIKQLQVKYPQHEFRLIIGQDNLENFTRWKDYQTLVDVFGLLVYPRFGAKPSPLSAHPNVSIVEAPLVDISATFIRDRIRRNQSVKYLVHHEVEMLISARRYYQV